jgi:hypothetical protein
MSSTRRKPPHDGGRRKTVGPRKVPHFDSGVIAEPLLAFGGQHLHIDPKTGLSLYGPHTPVRQARPVLSSIIVGIVGPPNMVADAERWLDACGNVLTNDGSEPFLYPHFPGIRRDSSFQCDLIYGETWRETLRVGDIASAVGEPNFHVRVKRVAELFVRAIEVLARREPKPHVILCCIPQDVVDHCAHRVTRAGEVKRIKISRAERNALERARRGERFLFPEMDPTLGIEEQESGHQNLRRAVKALAMRHNIPTQLVWPRTIALSAIEPVERRVQDVATRAWNFVTALYHKAGGTPWRLADIEPGTCFVGISFYRELAHPHEHGPGVHGGGRRLRPSG